MKNIFEDIPDDVSAEVFENLVENQNVTIERIISEGHSSPDSGWYDQEKNEWVLVLQGEAIISLYNESSVHLKEGDYLNIKAHQKHKVAWTAPDIKTIWLAVHY
ncbi:cupin domain-containing protein [Desulforhopalus vacuolatus]|uniref:cupin domain-containing protein n=1 Tax=Desulforhopalus vacuolatus TaxID=40414 RepID=UPI00196516C8|nr:cupin domain-containing protein [Desulforhopalus vacuolatus]